jgi:salicylate hydroxylase
MGDAAHATSPWQGAGLGQAFEDAMILATLLGRVSSPRELDAAFKAYDAVRRPRGQQVVDSSRGTGEIICGQKEDVGLDPDKLRGSLFSRWAFLDIDPTTHKQDALNKLRQIQEL